MGTFGRVGNLAVQLFCSLMLLIIIQSKDQYTKFGHKFYPSCMQFGVCKFDLVQSQSL